MQFTHEDIHKYQELCLKYFNEEIDEQAAIEELSNLVFLVSLIYHPLSGEAIARVKRQVEREEEHERGSDHSP